VKNTLQLWCGAGVPFSGFRDAAPGEFSRFTFNGISHAIQAGNNQRMQFFGYHGIELRGNRRSTTPPSFTNIPGTDSSGVIVYQENTDVLPLLVNSGLTLTSNLFQVQNNFSDRLRLSAAGTLWLNGGLRQAVAVIQAGGGAIIDFTPYINYGIIVLQPTDASGFTVQLPSIAGGFEGYQWRIVVAGWGLNRPVKLLSAAGDDINETGVGGTTGWTLNPNANNTRNGILSCVYFGGSLKQWYYAALIA
jgi:hypothetical protein